jgi:hypothetical protein
MISGSLASGSLVRAMAGRAGFGRIAISDDDRGPVHTPGLQAAAGTVSLAGMTAP